MGDILQTGIEFMKAQPQQCSSRWEGIEMWLWTSQVDPEDTKLLALPDNPSWPLPSLQEHRVVMSVLWAAGVNGQDTRSSSLVYGDSLCCRDQRPLPPFVGERKTVPLTFFNWLLLERSYQGATGFFSIYKPLEIIVWNSCHKSHARCFSVLMFTVSISPNCM